jgi:hypothetical protein
MFAVNKKERKVKNILFKNMFLMVWKYAQMHQKAFLTSSDVKK